MVNTAIALKEHITEGLNALSLDELVVIYEQIHLFEHIKRLRVPSENSVPIDVIRKMTSTSQSSWAKTVIEDREDRA